MKRSFTGWSIAVFALAVVSLAVPAHAITVTFSTTGAFTCGAGTCSTGASSITRDGATVTFTGVGSASVNEPTFASLGSISASGGTNDANPFGAGDTLTLTITQTVPSAGSGASSGTVTGTITPSGGSLISVTFPTPVTIGLVTYTITPTLVAVPAPGTSASIEALITAVPEPSTYALTGLALSGLLYYVRRRRAA